MTYPRKSKRRSSKRNRNRSGSSSSEGGITPVAKRDRPDIERSPQDNKDNPNMATVQENTAERECGVSAGLSAKLNAILLGQEQLSQDVNQSLTRHSQELVALIDQKMAGLKEEVDGKLAAITNDILEVQACVVALETRWLTGVVGGQAVITGLQKRVEDMQAGLVASGVTAPAPTLIIKGLPETPAEEDEDCLLNKCHQLLAEIQVTANIASVRRIGSVERGRKPRPVSMVLRSNNDLRNIMRSKRNLKDRDGYSNVYFEPDRPAEMRNVEANIRRLTRALPDLEYRRGRVRAKDGSD